MVLRQKMILKELSIDQLTEGDLDSMFKGFCVAGWGFFRPKKKMPAVRLELSVGLTSQRRVIVFDDSVCFRTSSHLSGVE